MITFLIIFIVFILSITRAIMYMLLKDIKVNPITDKTIIKESQIQLIKEKDSDIFNWYATKLNITLKSRGKVYRSLIMGLYLHKRE